MRCVGTNTRDRLHVMYCVQYTTCGVHDLIRLALAMEG